MKLRHPLLIRAVSLVMSWVLRAWLATLTYRFTFDDPGAAPRELSRQGRRAIYLFWHEMMLFPAHTHARQRIAVLISHHADGELIAQIVRMLGGQVVRGSTNKRGLSALRELMRRGRVGHLAITPDGPRGPRRRVQDGCVFLASRTGMPVVPVGFAFARCWRYRRSWDRMAFPKPGAVAQAVVGRPIEVPASLDRTGLEQYRQCAQAALDDVQRRAEGMIG
jgi:lysophospholipid acyltransferase (LPLAT)-like uncharacterized protein